MGKNRRAEQAGGLVVITGCDTGIGRSLVPICLQMGYHVLQSYLEQNNFTDEAKVYSRKMDLRIPEEVDGFCAYAKELCGKGETLTAVVINAGVALGGPIENLPMSVYRECFEINFFGAVKTLQALIPELIKSRGRILVNGSMAGRVALPFLSPYVSTKFALEGFCDSLRRELNPFGIKTVLLEPAAVATPIWNKAKAQDISFADPKYLDSLYSFRDNFIEGGNRGMDAHLAAARISDILEKRHPKARYVIAQNPMTAKLIMKAPSFLLDKAVINLYKMRYGG